MASLLHDLTKRRAQTSQAPTERLTAQQAALANCCPEGFVQVNAYAGTGKTSSLCALASRNPSKGCLYLAFNKSAQQDAARRFGANTRCITVHGLAFASHGKRYAHKLGQPRSIDIIKRMGLRWDWNLARLVIDTINAWCVSDLAEFPRSAQTIDGPALGNPILLAEAAGIAKQAWERMCDPSDPMQMPHDGYLKLYQLSVPRINCDLLMLDEAQDTNPVTWAIVKAQTCPVVIVGDRYQSIYKFRGAINAMATVKPTMTFPLTQSFRFGPRVARIASELLSAFHHEPTPVEGLGPDTAMAAPPEAAPRAFLSRTNAMVFQHAVNAIRSGQSLGFVGGVAAYGFDKLLDVNHLAQERNDDIRDEFVRGFPSFSHFIEYSKASGDLEAKRQIDIVLDYGDELEHLIPEIYRSAQTDLSKAFLVLATAHRSKGLTMDHVILADDFPEILDVADAPLEADVLDRQEINLIYVAMTRARISLQLNRSLRNFAIECGADIIFNSPLPKSGTTQNDLFD